ncbi:hypothetical protein KM043_011322 [Ampulex compressa]|nr:hypothetical protein KM043_011322 [Ampulex compressa]
MTIDKNFLNVLILSFGFMLVFTAFQTMGNIEKTILASINKEDSSFTGEAYTSLAIIYAVFATCNWSWRGPDVDRSRPVPDGEQRGQDDVQERGKVVFIVLSVLAVVGTGVLGLMKRPPQKLALGEAEGVSSADKELQMPEPRRERPLLAASHAFTDAFSLFLTPQMLLLSLTFIYTGLVLTFYSGVYSSSIGFTKAIGESRKRLVGLSGIFIGIGEVVGGAVFGILASKVSNVCGGWPVVVTGLCVHVFAFISIFLNLPNDAPFKDTDSLGYISSSPILAMAGSLALGFGDACFNTQVYSLLGVLYVKESAPAFALFKFCQSVAAAISFAYSSKVGLHIQLLVLVIAIVFGSIAFCFVEYRTKKSKDENRLDIHPDLVDGTSGED